MTPSTKPTTVAFEPYQSTLRMTETYSRSLLAWFKELSELLFDRRAPWNGTLYLVRQMSDVVSHPVQMIEKEREYKLAAEIPGLKAGDIDVRVADATLRISGERPERADDQSSMANGRFEREIPLPPAADPEKITADYHDGLLMISIPKSSGATREHKVAVKAA